MMKTELAWAAGLLDGEGSICIYKPGTGHNLIMSVAMTHKPTVLRLQHLFRCGSVHRLQRDNPKWRTAWAWSVSIRDAERVLRKTLPFLVTKALEARCALQFCRLPIAKSGRYGAGKYARIPRLLERKREALRLRLRALREKEWAA